MKKQLRLAGIVAGVAIIAAACGPSAGSAAPPADSTAPSVAPGSVAPGSEAPPAALEGEVTLWHSYGSGGGETGALTTVLDQVRAANPGLTINVVEQPFDQIFTKWRTDVAAGEGADMFIAPNDDLGKDAREESIANLDEYLAGNAALDGYLPVALDGSKVAVGDAAPAFYMVPESLKAVALWYDKAAVPTPPTTSDELLAAVKDGSVKIGINQGVYEAFAYLKELKDAGATFNTDGNALKTDFQTGKINAIIDGPWQTADFRTALADKLAVTTIPAGPSGPANPFTGTDGWYVNPNLDPAQQALAVNVALALTAPAAEQVFVDDAGHVPANPAVTISDPITQGFADAAAAGLPRPQNAEFGNWWGPFGDALNKVIDTGADPATAVADACKLMNEASGL
ncbi:MAG: extracellular solute-binding protein family 1 [Chloroflexota bacterium]|nr:extracellular solute-binding protein family 1 [Chloroflexota bacterium]